MDPLLWMAVGGVLSATGLIGVTLLVMRLDPWLHRNVAPHVERWITPPKRR